MKSIFWLSDDQMALINPYLPCRTAGKRREDDQRIISGIIMCSNQAAAGRTVPQNTVPIPRYITAIIVGRKRVFGNTCSLN